MESMTFVLFGATGDLAKRKIFPSLYNLYQDGNLPSDMQIFGLGRKNFTDDTFQTYVFESLCEFLPKAPVNREETEGFLKLVKYNTLNVDNIADYQTLLARVKEGEGKEAISENRLFYMSVSPELFEEIATNIKESGLSSTKGWKKLIIEKPFGFDLETARNLNDRLSKTFDESEIYRIDHYLGKQMVQNIETLRFSNRIIEKLWNRENIANIQITASEIVGVEERAAYYDKSGALRDMVQNHLLQMLMLVAMEPALETHDIHDEKVKAMEKVQISNLKHDVIRAQYTKGTMKEKEVIGYKEEDGVSPDSKTDTFIAAKLLTESDRWKGVPFYIRTGKRMNNKSTRIVIEFKKNQFEEYSDAQPDLLTIFINPDAGVRYTFNSMSPINTQEISPIEADYRQKEDNRESYEVLIHDAMKGESRYFARWDEVEYAWKLVQPILNAFKESEMPIYEYESGTQGPDASHKLLEKDGFFWWES